MHELILGIPAVPTKRSSHYIKGVLIGVMAIMALTLAVLLAFLWVCLLSKKERAARKYTEVKKQVDQEASMFSVSVDSSMFCFHHFKISHHLHDFRQAQSLLLFMVTCRILHVRS